MDDLLTELRATNPVPREAVSGFRARPEADELLMRITRARPRPRRALLVAAAILLVLLAAGALMGAVYLQRADSAAPGNVLCARDSNLLDGSASIGFGDDPVETCRSLWRAGRITGAAVVHPPDLTACVTPGHQILVVLPGDDEKCRQLGMARPKQEIPTERDRFYSALGIVTESCRNEADAIQVVTDVLRDHGRANWTVRVDMADHPETEDSPCAVQSIDELNQEVLLRFAPDARLGG